MEDTALRRYDDPVEVRKAGAGDTGNNEDPEQFLWRGRLWQVREVVAHWVETGAWWRERSELLAEREVWRVAAAHPTYRTGRPADDSGFGVFDLVFDWTTGDWRLAGVVD
jgi:hypothetical protein